MCVYEFPGIRESKMPQPYTQLSDIYRNLETFKKQSKLLPPHKKKKNPKQKTQNQNPHHQNCPRAWCDDMYSSFQVGKQPSTVLAMVVLSTNSASTEEDSILDGAYTLHLFTLTELCASTSRLQFKIIVLSHDCT